MGGGDLRIMMYRLLIVAMVLAVVNAGCTDKKQSKSQSPAGTSANVPGLQTFPYIIAVSGETPHQVGRFDQKSGAMVTKEGERGAVIFGPYVALDPGKYRATFKLKLDGSDGEITGTADVNPFTEGVTSEPAAKQALRARSGEQTIALDFDAAAGPKYEFRVFADGKGSIAVREIVVERR
jgi:hypothetical protein